LLGAASTLQIKRGFDVSFRAQVSRLEANSEPKTQNLKPITVLGIRLGLGQTDDAVTGLENAPLLEELDSLKPFQHVSLSLDGAGSF
jgi:hypothetical protein